MPSRLSRMVRNALTMMVGTLASRVLGLIREILTAALFGASRQLDAFYIAYTLANLARQLLAEGALSAAFVPVFSQVLARDGRERAERLARQALAVLVAAGSLVVLFGIVLSPWLVRLMAPGFDPVKASMAVNLTRAMFPFLLVISMAALAMGVLNSMDCFFIPAVAPALSNFAYIIVILSFASRMGIWSLVVAVLLGGVLQFGLQWVWSARLSMPLYPAMPDRNDRELRRMLSLFLPYAAGLSLNQVNPVISRMLGSFLQDGAISVLNYANRLIQLPLGLVVIAISQAVLPELSRCSLENTDQFIDMVRDAMRFALFIIMPITVGAIMVADPVVHLLFYRGAFNVWAWHSTARALAMYALGLPGMACTTVIMRALYARSLPRHAIIVTVSSVASNLFFSLLLVRYLSFTGLALAVSIAFTISSFTGEMMLARNLKGRIGVFSPGWSLRLATALFFMGGAIAIFSFFWAYPSQMKMLYRSLWVIAVTGVGCAAYSVSTLLMRFNEWKWIGEAMKRRSGRS